MRSECYNGISVPARWREFHDDGAGAPDDRTGRLLRERLGGAIALDPANWQNEQVAKTASRNSLSKTQRGVSFDADAYRGKHGRRER